MMGYKAADGRTVFGKARFIDQEGNTVKISASTVKEALAYADADEAVAESIGKVDEVFAEKRDSEGKVTKKENEAGLDTAKQVLS
jgi:hypothetical protein